MYACAYIYTYTKNVCVCLYIYIRDSIALQWTCNHCATAHVRGYVCKKVWDVYSYMNVYGCVYLYECVWKKIIQIHSHTHTHTHAHTHTHTHMYTHLKNTFAHIQSANTHAINTLLPLSFIPPPSDTPHPQPQPKYQ